MRTTVTYSNHESQYGEHKSNVVSRRQGKERRVFLIVDGLVVTLE